MIKWLKHLWHKIRRISGDDAYEQYVKHHTAFHSSSEDAPALLSRKAFYKLWQDNKWNKINRCC
ncbi:MAG: CstA-like transporter-associated (seleno)protein [Methylophilaceae bacterium]